MQNGTNGPSLLSPELVSLVHHIELNKAGWWDLAVQRLVLTCLWCKRDKIAQNSEEIIATLKNEFRVPLVEAALAKHLQTLTAGGQVVVLPDGRYKLTEQAVRDCERDLSESAQLEARVKQRFQVLVDEICPDLEFGQVWSAFHEKFLLPMVNQMGANTYRLITGDRVEVETPHLSEFTQAFDSFHTVNLHHLARQFLDPTNADVRRYVLRTMNAYFVVRAGGLNDQTIHRLAASASKLPDAVLFFDTNVLFSLLGLHENPADEGSLALINLVRKISADVPIKLRVLPPTLDEMRRAITASQEAVINMRISPQLLSNVANAGISGITEKFLRLSAARGATVSPADYFEPYLNNLLTILRGNGIDLFSQDLGPYRKRQDVIDDLLLQQDFEKKKYGDRAKNYERLEHDMILWHFVRDKRPVQIESPIDAGYWLVTADYRLLGFDAHKQRELKSTIPICLHPATLAQLLQFWVPQTAEFEEALLSTMRLPTVLTVLDSDAERVSLRILNALSTFENIGNLPPETTTRILLNEALRQKLRVEDDVAKQVELVREALVEENKKAEARLEEERLKGLKLQQIQENLQQQLSTATAEVVALKGALQEQEDANAQSIAEKERIQRKLDEIEQKAQRAEQHRFVLLWSFLLLATCALIWACLRASGATVKHTSAAMAGGAVVWMFIAERAGRRSPSVREWGPFQEFERLRLWVYGTLLAGALGNAVWDGMKYLWGN